MPQYFLNDKGRLCKWCIRINEIMITIMRNSIIEVTKKIQLHKVVSFFSNTVVSNTESL